VGEQRLQSPGRPPVARRKNYQRFWASIAAGRSSEDVAIDAGYHQPWAAGGFGGRAACHRHIFCRLQGPYRDVIYRWPSAKRSPSCGFRSIAFAPLPASSGEPLRGSLASCAGMPRHVAADWNIGRPPRIGMPIVRCVVPKQPSWRGMKPMSRYVQDRLAGAVTTPDGVKIHGPKATGKHADRDAGSTDGGQSRGARNRLLGVCRSTFPLMIRCASVTRRFTKPV
jgi:hypothetical protein